ncbi:SCO6745 family protein [Streptomyces sp. MAR4 CNX-425]|uniref:SCO6745 family protein n=1 Tax=Streptomyces sp. MAR4 CNX-425 TaxID=3406343 RepID=UPI003B501BD7
MTSLPPRAGRRCHQVLNPLHSAIYFSPEFDEEFAAIGIHGWHAAYFTARAAAMGPVGAGVVTATFYNYSHRLVAEHVPAAWSAADPATVLAARLRVADAVLRRLLGEETIASPELAEAAWLAQQAAAGGERAGRPLYAAEAGLPEPDAPHLALWQAATLLREHRGDSHNALLAHAGLDGLESQVTHTASGFGFTPEFARRSRGWEADEWAAAQERLRARGLLTADGELTEAGTALRKGLEDETDRVDLAPYEYLGAAGVARLTELATGYTTTALAAGALPKDIFGKG